MEVYLNTPCSNYHGFDPIIWWKNHCCEFPTLSLMARDFLAIPATSAPSERVFSTCGLIITKKRNRMAPELLDALVCLQQWNEIELNN